MELYIIKVELQGTNPIVWRRLLVPPQTSLRKFHNILQKSMGWKNSHSHQFSVRVIPWKKLNESLLLEKKALTTMDDLVYKYGRGDGWIHDIRLIGMCIDEGLSCVEGAMACPPEDCGSFEEYYGLSRVKFDFKAFDIDEVNEELKKLR
jgi:hypothetical protein